MKSIIFIILALSLVGCAREAESMASSSNPHVEVSKLFEVDGCTIYRFEDARYHYFARCANSSSVIEAHTESCGKNCIRKISSEVPTVYENEHN